MNEKIILFAFTMVLLSSAVLAVQLAIADDVNITARRPVADFSYSPSEPVEGEVVTFDASASHDPDEDIEDYGWDFGDGDTTSGVIVTHAYSEAGTYDVTLTIIDDDERTDSTKKEITVFEVVHDIAVKGVKASPDKVKVGQLVSIEVKIKNEGTVKETFDLSVYYDAGLIETQSGVSLDPGAETTLVFTWDTDGITEGTYRISGEASAVAGEEDLADNTYVDGRVILDANKRHDIAITDVTVSPASVREGKPVSISVTVVNQGSFRETFEVTAYYDSAEIGTRTEVSLDAGSTTTIALTWRTNGVDADTYTISARASVVSGETDTGDNVFTDGEVTVSRKKSRGGGGGGSGGSSDSRNEEPMAGFTYSPDTPTALDTVQFSDESHDPDGSVASWLWDFGDDSNSDEKDPTHHYVENGKYVVTLTVQDDEGARDEITKEITVLNVPPEADFAITYPPNAQQPTSEDIIGFKDQSSDPDGSIVSWLWDFGDGTISTDQNPDHKYEDAGTYTIELSITDDDGATDTISTVLVLFQPKVVDLLPPTSMDDYDGLWHTEDFTINITSVDNHSGVQAIYYRMNGGSTDRVQVDGRLHITMEGNNILEYWSIDRAGNEEAHNIIYVKLDKTLPIPNLGGDISATKNVTVAFDANGSSDNIGIASYDWDFGDGNKGTGLITTHTYRKPGVYEPKLTVKDAAGNENTDTSFITIFEDTDGDRVHDVMDTDDDGDGMPDSWEMYHGLNPLEAIDASQDRDGDGICNLEEWRLATDPSFYFSPFPWWIFVLVAVSGIILIIIHSYFPSSILVRD